MLKSVTYLLNYFTLFTEKKKIGHFIDEDPDLLESLGKKRRKSTHKNSAVDEDDDEFSPTVKERDRKMREKRKEAAKRVRNSFFLCLSMLSNNRVAWNKCAGGKISRI